MQYITLRKSGGFYICFDNDAIVLSYLCNYKINNGRVGFPIGAIDKVINILENSSVSYVVKVGLDETSLKKYGKKNKYKFYLDKGKCKISLDNRINKILEKINNLKEEEVIRLLDLIEDNI